VVKLNKRINKETAKMRCRKVRQTLSAYLDGALPAGKYESMTAHLETCLECRQTLNQLQELKPLLAGLSIPAMPDGLTAQVLARAQERLEQRRSDRTTMPSWSLLRWWALETPAMRLAAVVILAIGLSAGFMLGRSTSTIPIRFAFSASVRQKQQPDPMAMYGFDSLFSDTSGSIEQAYLTLTFDPARKEG
jgi:anti-sigma factor RsiW